MSFCLPKYPSPLSRTLLLIRVPSVVSLPSDQPLHSVPAADLIETPRREPWAPARRDVSPPRRSAAFPSDSLGVGGGLADLPLFSLKGIHARACVSPKTKSPSRQETQNAFLTLRKSARECLCTMSPPWVAFLTSTQQSHFQALTCMATPFLSFIYPFHICSLKGGCGLR